MLRAAKGPVSGGAASAAHQLAAPADPEHADYVLIGSGEHPTSRLAGRMKNTVEMMRTQAPTNPRTGEFAPNKLKESCSLAGIKGGPIGGRYCPGGIDGQHSMRFTNPTNGLVFSHSTVRAPEENDKIRALVGSMTSTTNPGLQVCSTCSRCARLGQLRQHLYRHDPHGGRTAKPARAPNHTLQIESEIGGSCGLGELALLAVPTTYPEGPNLQLRLCASLEFDVLKEMRI
jgi:hypothetical protein